MTKDLQEEADQSFNEEDLPLSKESEEDYQDKENEKAEEKDEGFRFRLPQISLPKWLIFFLGFLIPGIHIMIILLIDHYRGFPATINPIALIALPGLALLGFVAISELLYRNVIVYSALQKESRDARRYKKIIKDQEEKEAISKKYEYIEDDNQEMDSNETNGELTESDYEDEYVYEDDDDYENYEDEYVYEDDEDYEDEYVYEDEISEEERRNRYKMKSLVFRGGIFSVLSLMSIVLLALAFILQIFYMGGFTPQDNSTTT
jgi:hypothetical protein